MALHVSQAAASIDTTSTRRLGTVQARTSSGDSLGSMEAEWALPWNNADIDMEVSSGNPQPHPLGGVALGQKTTRTQSALTELVASWNDQMKTTTVTSLPTYRQPKFMLRHPPVPEFQVDCAVVRVKL